MIIHTRPATAPRIPVIDLAGLSKPYPEEHKAGARDSQKACGDTGPFHVSNHGIALSLDLDETRFDPSITARAHTDDMVRQTCGA